MVQVTRAGQLKRPQGYRIDTTTKALLADLLPVGQARARIDGHLTEGSGIRMTPEELIKVSDTRIMAQRVAKGAKKIASSAAAVGFGTLMAFLAEQAFEKDPAVNMATNNCVHSAADAEKIDCTNVTINADQVVFSTPAPVNQTEITNKIPSKGLDR